MARLSPYGRTITLYVAIAKLRRQNPIRVEALISKKAVRFRLSTCLHCFALKRSLVECRDFFSCEIPLVFRTLTDEAVLTSVCKKSPASSALYRAISALAHVASFSHAHTADVLSSSGKIGYFLVCRNSGSRHSSQRVLVSCQLRRFTILMCRRQGTS